MSPGHTDTHTDTVRIPGVRYRRRRDAGVRPVTRDGRTHWVKVDTWEPRPPLDVDLIVRRAALAVALLLLAGVVLWSTVSITQLLTSVAPLWAALCAAAVYDAAWIMCLALEWLARHDRSRARAPRIAGWLALAAAMVAIFAAHGMGDSGGYLVGAVGAAVSGIAKGVWALLLRNYTHRLDADTQAWVDAERGELAGQQVVGSLRRDVARSDAQVAAQRAALGLSPVAPMLPSALAPEPVSATVSESNPSPLTPVSAPPAPPERAPATASAPTPAPEPAAVDTRTDTANENTDTGGATVSPIAPSMSALVRDALASGATDTASVLAHVQTTHPAATAPTVARLIRRAQKAS